MHARASSSNGQRVGSSKPTSPRPEGAVCACGCGKAITPNWNPALQRWGLFARGHRVFAAPVRSRDEWKQKLDVINANRPTCKCGCGLQVKEVSLDAFIRGRHAQFSKYIRGHHSRHTVFSLTEDERSAIFGTLLGDSSINYPNPKCVSPRVYGNHSIKQEAWVRHKAEFLSRLQTSVAIAPNKGYGETICRWRTRLQPCLREIHDLVVKDGKKRITTEWLNSLGKIGLAWWICDDGSASDGSSITLHTEGYSREESEIIAAWLRDGWLEYATVQKAGKYFRVRMSHAMSIRVAAYCWTEVPKCMRYKVDISC